MGSVELSRAGLKGHAAVPRPKPGRVAVRTAVALFAALGLIGLASCQDGSAREGGPPGRQGGRGGAARPVPVSVAAAERRNVPVQLRTFGTVEAINSVQVRAQVSDALTAVHIDDGQRVAASQPLFTIDSRASQIALLAARANLARDMAQLVNARAEAGRQAELLRKNIASPADCENAQAAAAALAATTQGDEAAVQNARLQLEHCHILSPIDGVAGRVLVKAGNLVKANDTLLVVINQVQPINVYFAIPQRELAAVRSARDGGRRLTVLATPRAESGPERGELTFVDNTVDKSTGTVMLGGRFDNRGGRLWPGRFVDVVLTLGELSDVVVVPARAVQTGRDRKFVLVVKPDRTVEVRPVTVVQSDDEQAVIAGGEGSLDGGETVVTDGHFRLTNGSKVEIKSALPAHDSATTRPATQPADRGPASRPARSPASRGRRGNRP